MIGEILVTPPAPEKPINLNRWMVKNGWAFPAFYVSMTAEEIAPYAKDAHEAQGDGRGIWPSFTKTVQFDPTLIHKRPKKGETAKLDADDPGEVLFPKIFRRLVTEYVATGDTKALREFLGEEQRPDKFVFTNDFVELGKDSAVQHDLTEVVTSTKINFEPAEVMFLEGASTLFDKNGHKITRW
jgi:hypothetical protein